jgi:glycosyltransferase involved in cell wall biosynthesis
VRHFSIITTCKGRLHHLKQSLPRFLQQADAEVIVVDYDCPDGTADYVRRTHPEAKVVAVTDAPVFNISDARNRGAAAAVGTWLAFLDADVMIAPDMFDRVAATIETRGHAFRRYFRFHSGPLSLFGSCVVLRADFQAVQGYDVAIQNYGGEDNEFYARLERRKITRLGLDADLVETCLEHSQEDRVQFFKRKSVLGSMRINTAYRLVKSALLQQYGVPELPEEMRRAIYDLVRRSVKEAFRAGQTTVRIEVPLPDDHETMPNWKWEAKRHLTFELNLQQTGAAAEKSDLVQPT